MEGDRFDPRPRRVRGHGWRDPAFRIAFLFHSNIDLLGKTLPRCVHALTSNTRESFEVILHCDGTPPDVGAQVVAKASEWGVDEVRVRRRDRHLASGDASNNGHRRLFDLRSPYLVVVEDDVTMYRTEASFDVLMACTELFTRHPDVPVICKVDDHDQWAWKLRDLGPVVEPGVRSVNRVSTHFVAYRLDAFRPVAERFGAFDMDVFIDRDDLSYNWEDVVSHAATTGGRRIAFPGGWSLRVFHCDRKVKAGSMYHTQDPRVKDEVFAQLDARYGCDRPVTQPAPDSSERSP